MIYTPVVSPKVARPRREEKGGTLELTASVNIIASWLSHLAPPPPSWLPRHRVTGRYHKGELAGSSIKSKFKRGRRQTRREGGEPNGYDIHTGSQPKSGQTSA